MLTKLLPITVLFFCSITSLASAQEPLRSAPGASSTSERYRAWIDTKDCRPVYPRSSVRNSEQGTVTLAFHIDADGSLLESKIVRSSGFRDLDRAAHEAMRKCKLHPEVNGGVPVRSWLEFNYVWNIKDYRAFAF